MLKSFSDQVRNSIWVLHESLQMKKKSQLAAEVKNKREATCTMCSQQRCANEPSECPEKEHVRRNSNWKNTSNFIHSFPKRTLQSQSSLNCNLKNTLPWF